MIKTLSQPQIHFPSDLLTLKESITNNQPILNLISKVWEEGGFSIDLENLSHRGAWIGGKDRKILFNREKIHNNTINKTELLSVFVFELLNAASESKFEALREKARRNEIEKEAFVEEIERIEHDNALKAKDLVKDVDVFEDFAIHYRFQQLRQHSDKIVKRYEILNLNADKQIFHGTLSHPVDAGKLISEDYTNIEIIALLKMRLLDKKTTQIQKTELKIQIGFRLLLIEQKLSSERFKAFEKAILNLFSQEELNSYQLAAISHLQSN